MSNKQVLEAVREIREWSWENFGNQKGDGLELGRIAPLLGILEEFGEFCRSKDVEDSVDAVADALIFMVDYLARSGWANQDIVNLLTKDWTDDEGDIRSLVLAMCGMCAAELKRVQGIRGMQNIANYRKRQLECIRPLTASLARELRRRGRELVPTFLETWQAVRKRNWKKNRNTGVAPSDAE